MGRKENLVKGRRFSSTYQPPNRGRKPSVIPSLIREHEISITDIRAVIHNILFVYSVPEIEAILKDKTNPLPVGIVAIIRASLKDSKKGGILAIDKLLDRTIGKPTQFVEIKPPPEDLMTREERQARIKELLEKYADDAAGRKRTVTTPGAARKGSRKPKDGKVP